VLGDSLRPRLADVAARAGEQATGRVRVSRACTIQQFDTIRNIATIIPAVRERVIIATGEVWADEIAIPNVPVLWPGDGSGVSVTWPLPVGAVVLMLVRDVSHDEVDSGGALPASPVSARRWDLSDVAVLPFGWSARDPLQSDAYSGTQPVIRLPVNRAVLIGANTAARALALATETAAKLAAIEGVLNALVLPVSGATAGPPTPIPFPTPTVAADIQTTRIKVDTQ
jgi:hypothetical protein